MILWSWEPLTRSLNWAFCFLVRTFREYLLCPKFPDPALVLRSVRAALGACLKSDSLQALLFVHLMGSSTRQVSRDLVLNLHLVPHETWVKSWCQLPTCSPALLTEFCPHRRKKLIPRMCVLPALWWLVQCWPWNCCWWQHVNPLKNALILKSMYTWNWTQQKFKYSKVNGSRWLETIIRVPHTLIQSWGSWIWCQFQSNFWHAFIHSSSFWSPATSSENVHWPLAQTCPFLSVRGLGMGNFQRKEPKRWCKSSFACFLVSGGWESLPHLLQSKPQELLSPSLCLGFPEAVGIFINAKDEARGWANCPPVHLFVRSFFLFFCS